MPPTNLIVQPAIVKATYVESRLIDVEVIGYKVVLRKVPVVTGPQDYSMPSVGDTGLVIGTEHNAYYLGKIDFDYKGKTAGTVDVDTGLTLIAKKVNDGETFINNLFTRTWIAMTGGGDFSFCNAIFHGLQYSGKTAVTEIGGNLLRIVGNGVRAAFGAVMRDLPTPDTIIPSTVPLVPAVEVMIELKENLLRMVRFHLGHVKDELGIDEMSGYAPARIRALLDVCNAASLPVSKISVDEMGNIEIETLIAGNIDLTAATAGCITLTTAAGDIDLASTTGNISATTPVGNVLISSSTGAVTLDGKPVSGVLLAGSSSAYSAVFGEPLLAWLTSHVHPTAVGPSGPPTPPPVPATLLSQKVKLA